MSLSQPAHITAMPPKESDKNRSTLHKRQKLSERRKHLLNRLGALIKNLDATGEDFILDKQLDRAVSRMEKTLKHHRTRHGYRKLRAEARSAEQAQEAEAEAAAEE